MTYLPIIARELLVASRRKGTYAVRFWTAAAAVVAGAVLLVVLSYVPFVPGMGWPVFQGLAGVCFFYCIVLCNNTVDCVSEEKREDTLGLLFLTDLSGWDVALGKLCANSLKSFYAILGTFPVVAVVLLLGGVSAGQFCKVALALLNIFFFAHVTGLLGSVLSRGRTAAAVITVALLYGFLGGPPLLALALGHGRFTSLSLLLAAFSPGYAFVQMMLPTGGRFYWTSLALVHLVSWFFLAVASARLPYCWQEKAGARRLRWRDRFRQWTYGPPAMREGVRRELAGRNPFLWLASRNRLGPLIFRGGAILLGCLWIWVWFLTAPDERLGWMVFAVCVNHFLLLCVVAAEASSHLERERRSGALEFVLCATPLRVEEILAGQWELLRRLFLRPLLAVLACDMVMAILSQSRLVAEDAENLVWFVAGTMLMLVVHVVAAGWVGMWRGMAQKLSRKSSGAGSATIEVVGLLVFMPFMGLWMIAGLIVLLFKRDFGQYFLDSFGAVFGLWFLLSLAAALGFGFLGRKKLLTRFREMAAVQTGEPPGIFAQLGRWLGKMMR
jgi:hypothetical protein